MIILKKADEGLTKGVWHVDHRTYGVDCVGCTAIKSAKKNVYTYDALVSQFLFLF